MASFETELARAKAFQQAGERNKAQALYYKLLKEQPQNASLHHLLAMLHVQCQQYEEAINSYQRAIAISPNSALLHTQLGNTYKAAKNLAAAEREYKKSLQIDNDHSLAHHNLGVLYYQQGRIELAITHYTQAIKLKPDYIDAHFHLAICHLKTGSLGKAKTLLLETIRLFPKHFSALFYLGTQLMREESFLEAIQYFKRAEKIKMDHVELQINMGHCFLHTKQYMFARDCYRYALELQPGDADLHFNLGVLGEKESYTNHAINHYLDAIRIDANYFAAHYNIANLFLEKEHVAKAVKHLEIAKKLQPNNESVAFILQAILKDERLTSAPKTHIQSLFDQYADSYDKHLIEALDYSLPQELLKLLTAIEKDNGLSLRILDLGCGTGLCGQSFQSIAKEMIGVDLSTNMLQEAKQKKIYDKLYQEEILQFLRSDQRHYDLIIAGDVLVYLGELDEFFRLAKQRLSTKGRLLFNVEEGSKAPYNVDQSGRFLHHPSYISKLCDLHQLNLVRAISVSTRQQNSQPVAGLLFYIENN